MSQPIDFDNELDEISIVFGKDTREEMLNWIKSIVARIEKNSLRRCKRAQVLNQDISKLKHLYSLSNGKKK